MIHCLWRYGKCVRLLDKCGTVKSNSGLRNANREAKFLGLLKSHFFCDL